MASPLSSTPRRTFCAGLGALVAGAAIPVPIAVGAAERPSATGVPAAARRLRRWLERFAVVEPIPGRIDGTSGRVLVRCRRRGGLASPIDLAAALADRESAPFGVLHAEGSRLFCEIDGIGFAVDLAVVAG